MAEEKTRRDFTRTGDGDPNPGGEYVLTGSRYVYREADTNVLVVKRRGDRIRLNDEQAQRLRAGKPGAPFQREMPEEDEDLVTVAVANEATIPADEDGFTASPEGRTNRRVRASAPPEAREAAGGTKEGRDEGIPAPTTTTASKSAPKR